MKAAEELIGKVDTIKESGDQNGAARCISNNPISCPTDVISQARKLAGTICGQSRFDIVHCLVYTAMMQIPI